MDQLWELTGPGVLVLPSNRRVRGRGLHRPAPDGPAPTWSLQLSGRLPSTQSVQQQWIRWPDFWVPTDFAAAIATLRQAYSRASTERVEIACGRGVGRTGTALAACVIFDGLGVEDAVAWVREGYHPRAVEVPWQRLFLRAVVRSEHA